MKFDGYADVICWHHGLDQVYFERFGSYQGEWAMLAKNDKTGNFYFFKDSYGSCSGCDSFEAMVGYSDTEITEEKAHNFAKDYKPFCEIPIATMKNLCENGTLIQVLPANTQFDDMDNNLLAKTLMLAAKIHEKWPIKVEEILEARNQEMRQRALKVYGQAQFIADSGAKLLHKDSFGDLWEVKGIKIVRVVDPSTGRIYFLSVPPAVETAKAAVASTFGLTEAEYAPLVEA